MRLSCSIMLMALSLSSPSVAVARSEGEQPPPEPDWDLIAFEVKSWGAPIHQWQFSPLYGGVWIGVERKDDPSRIVWTKSFHTLDADGARYAELEALVRKLPRPAPDAADCSNMMTDMPYGTIRLTRGATTTEIAWQSGCLDDGYAGFIATLREADSLVTEWGKAVPVSRTEDQPVP